MRQQLPKQLSTLNSPRSRYRVSTSCPPANPKTHINLVNKDCPKKCLRKHISMVCGVYVLSLLWYCSISNVMVWGSQHWWSSCQGWWGRTRWGNKVQNALALGCKHHFYGYIINLVIFLYAYIISMVTLLIWFYFSMLTSLLCLHHLIGYIISCLAGNIWFPLHFDDQSLIILVWCNLSSRDIRLAVVWSS